jgi:hypothetical protein
VKNAHLVHVLPMGWSPDSGAESDKGDKRASSSLSPSTSAGPSRSAGYIKTPPWGRTGGTCKPKLVQSIEQFLLSFAYPLGSLVSGHFSSGLNSGSGAGLSSSSLNLKQRPKSALVLSSASNIDEKEHAPPLRASTLPDPSPSTSNLTNIKTPLKPMPYLLAPGVFASCAGRSNVRSRCSLLEDDLGQNHDTHTDPETTALTIGEIILLGALDFDHTRPGTGPGNGRAWIGDVDDVVVVAGGSPDPGLSSRKVGIGKGKGREVAVVNTEMTWMKTTKMNFDGLLTPPESFSSNNSTESVEEEEEEEMINSTGHTQTYARPNPPALSTYSPPTHLDLDDRGNRNSTLNTRSKFSKRVTSSLSPPSAPASTIFKLKQTKNTSDKVKDKKSNRFSDSLFFATPASTILKSRQTNNNSDKVKDKNSNRFSDSLSSPSPLPLPSRSPIQQPPPLVFLCDRARSPRGSGDSYDLGLGHGVPVLPPMTASTIKPGSRSGSGSGMGSAMIPLQTQGEDDACKNAYGKTRSPNKKGSERKGFVVSALRKIGLWNKW